MLSAEFVSEDTSKEEQVREPENYNEKKQVEKLVEAIKRMKEDSSPETRLSDSVVEVSQPFKTGKKSSRKKVGTPKFVASLVKNFGASPKLKQRRTTRTTAMDDKVEGIVLETEVVKTSEK